MKLEPNKPPEFRVGDHVRVKLGGSNIIIEGPVRETFYHDGEQYLQVDFGPQMILCPASNVARD